MAQRGFARAFRAIFGHRHPSNPTDQLDQAPSQGSRYDTDGSSYDEEIQLNPPTDAPAANSRPQHHSDPSLQNGQSPKLHTSRNHVPSNQPRPPLALTTFRDDAAPSVEDETPSSQISLRPRRRQASRSVVEPRGAETSHEKPHAGAGDAMEGANMPKKERTQANTQVAATGKSSGAVGEPVRFAGRFLPAPSAGTDSAIVERPELVEIGGLDEASLEKMQRLCRKLGLERSGGKERLRERIRAKLAQPRVLNEESMFIDADGNPHTPVRESWLAACRRPEEARQCDGSGVQGGDRRSHVTTTTVDQVKEDGADGQQNEGIAGKSHGGTMAKSGQGEIANSDGGGLARASGLSSQFGDGATIKSGPIVLSKSDEGISKAGGKPGKGFDERDYKNLELGSNPASNNVATARTGLAKAGAEKSAFGRRMKPKESHATNGVGHHCDLDRNPGFVAPSLKNPVKAGDGAGKSVSREVIGNADGGPSQSVDARGGAREGVEVDKLLDGFGNKNQKLTPAEYNSCLKASSGKVIAQRDKGAAALLVSKSGPATSSYLGSRDQRHCAAIPDKGEINKNRDIIEGKKQMQREARRRNIEMRSVRQVLGANDSEVEADIASERNFSMSPLSKSDYRKQTGMGSNPATHGSTSDKDRDKRQKFTFNLNIVDKGTGEDKPIRRNPFQGVFAGAAGGPSAHNTVGFNNNRAANATPPAADDTNAKGNRDSHADNDIPMTEEKEEIENAHGDDSEGQRLPQEQEYATPREILRSFNQFGPDAMVSEDDRRNLEHSGPGRESSRSSPRDEMDYPGATNVLPRYLRGFSSMSRPSQIPRHSASFTRDWDGAERAAGLSSLRPRRPTSTASAGLFVNLRNSSLAPENKYIAERLQKRGSLGEHSTRPSLSSSSLRILQELKKVREENRALTSNKRTMSPMPVPPSVAKRIKRAGEFNKNAVRRDLPSQSGQDMPGLEKDTTENLEAVAPAQSGGSSSAYPLTPLKPLPRLKATPASTKKRKSVAFGSGRKRPKSTTFSNAAISEMRTLTEKDSDKIIQGTEKVPSGQPLKFGPTSTSFDGGTLLTQSARLQSPPRFASPSISAGQHSISMLREKNGEPKLSKQPSVTAEKAHVAAPSLSNAILFSSRNGEPNNTSAEQKATDVEMGSSLNRSELPPLKPLSGADDASVSKRKQNPLTPDKSKGAEERSSAFMFGSVPQAVPSLREKGDSLDSTLAANTGNETRQPRSDNGTGIDATSLPASYKASASEMFPKVSVIHEIQSESHPSNETRDETRESLQRRDTQQASPSEREKQSHVSAEAAEPPKVPAVQSGLAQTAAAENVSAYDIFKKKIGTVTSPNVADPTSPAQGSITGAAPASAPSITPTFSFGATVNASNLSTFATDKAEVKGSNEENMKKVNHEADKELAGTNMPSAFGVNFEAPASSHANAASPGLDVFGGKGAPGFTFSASQTSAEKATDAATAQEFTLNTSAAAPTTVPSMTTSAIKEATVGSLFSAPPSNSFALPSDTPINASEQLAEKPFFPLGNGKSNSQFGSSVPPNANKVDNVKPFDPFAQVASHGARTTAAELTKPVAVFGAAIASDTTSKPAASGFTFGSTHQTEKSPGLQTDPAARMNKNPFSIKSSQGNEEAGSSGSVLKSSVTLPETSMPASGQSMTQSAAQSSSVIGSTPQPLFSQPASAPVFSFGNTAGQAASSSQAPGLFSFSAPARTVEKDPSGPFGGPQFQSTFNSKPSGNTFVFGASSSSQALSTPGSGINGPAVSASKVPASTFVFGASSSPQPPAVLGNGMNQAGVGTGQPNSFGSSSQQTNNPFGAPASASVLPFGSTPSAPLTPVAPFTSMAQTPTPNVNPFVQSQPGLGGVALFGASQPGLSTNTSQGVQPAFGSAAGGTSQIPSFGGFGNATNNQPFGTMDTMMGMSQGSQNQFGAPLSSSLPAFGGGNPAGGGGFNIGMKQQQPANRRNRRILRGRRINR